MRNGKESQDDKIIKDVENILKSYDITLNNLICILNIMQENNIYTVENFKNEE